MPVVNATVGIDRGLLDTVAVSTGEKVGNERFFRRDENRLAKAQHRLSRKQKGSRHRSQARRKVARIQARIADRGRDFTHQLTTRLIRENQVVCAEGWNVKGRLAQPTLAQSIATWAGANSCGHWSTGHGGLAGPLSRSTTSTPAASGAMSAGMPWPTSRLKRGTGTVPRAAPSWTGT